MKVQIITDSTSDLGPELMKKYDVKCLPLHILLGADEYRDGVDITPDQIYEWSDRNRQTPGTSAPALTDAMDLLQSCDDENHSREMVCFSISSSMSTSGNVMRMAADELDMGSRVHVIDSRNLSTGSGLLIIEAAVMAENGSSAEEIVNTINKLIPRVRASFVVDTLTYLARGGRCSSVTALMGGALKLHPRIVVEDGDMKVSKKYRGKMTRVILDYVKDLDSMLRTAKPDRVFITHSGRCGEVLDLVREHLESLKHFNEILVTRAGGVISSHCGPGTLGVLFMTDEQQE